MQQKKPKKNTTFARKRNMGGEGEVKGVIRLTLPTPLVENEIIIWKLSE